MNAATTPSQSSRAAAIDACRALFGEHPEDVIAPIKCAADALWWLDEIFKTLSREELHERNSIRIKHLSECGSYLANEFANFAGCQHEAIQTRISKFYLNEVAAIRGDR